MVSDIDIWRSATQDNKRHDQSAGYYAASKVDELAEQGDMEGAAVWRRILKAVEQLLDTETPAWVEALAHRRADLLVPASLPTISPCFPRVRRAESCIVLHNLRRCSKLGDQISY